MLDSSIRHACEGRHSGERGRAWIPASAGMTTERRGGLHHVSCLRRQASKGNGEGLDPRLRGNDDGEVLLVATRVIPAKAGIQVRMGI